MLSEVCKYLALKHINLSPQNQWLQDCVSCFKEQFSNASLKNLQDFVFEQWQLADLADVNSSTLPQDCLSSKKKILSGYYAVQINSVVNIGESFYKQMQKIRTPTAWDNLAVDADKESGISETSDKRVLKLELSDGVTQLKGFENKPIKKLREPVIPGVKVILNGPIECRKGLLFLSDENITVVGGEVDGLHIPNAVENILARSLGLPENPDPYKLLQKTATKRIDSDDEEIESMVLAAEEIESSCNSNPSLHSSSRLSDMNSHSNKNALIISSDDDDEFALIAAQTASVAEQSKVESNRTAGSIKQGVLDNFFCSPSGSNLTKERTKKKVLPPLKGAKKINMPGKELREQMEKSYESFSDSKRTMNEKNYENSVDILTEYNLKTESRQLNFEMPRPHGEEGKILIDQTKDISLSDLPNDYLESKSDFASKMPSKSFDEFPPKNIPCTLILQGEVVRLCQKLSIKHEKWVLSAVMKIKGLETEVDFKSEVLDKLLGLTALELLARKSEVKQNPATKERINEILKSSQQRIVNLNSKLKIHFSSFISKPTILDIYD